MSLLNRCVMRGVIGVAGAACAAPALADIPVIYDQGSPSGTGTGQATKTVNSFETFSNGFNGFSMSGSLNPVTLNGSSFGSGFTGGGIGGPPPASSFSSVNVSSSTSSFAPGSVLTLSITGNVSQSIQATAANESAYTSGTFSFSFSFRVTSIVIGQWDSSGNVHLQLNGSDLPLGNSAVWNLNPGVYRIYGNDGVSQSVSGAGSGSSASKSASATLKVGVPAPSSLALLGLAGLCTHRRRTRRLAASAS